MSNLLERAQRFLRQSAPHHATREWYKLIEEFAAERLVTPSAGVALKDGPRQIARQCAIFAGVYIYPHGPHTVEIGTACADIHDKIIEYMKTLPETWPPSASEPIVEERIACAKAMCPHCREGKFAEYQSDPQPAYWHDATRCRASEIWVRGRPSDALGAYMAASVGPGATK